MSDGRKTLGLKLTNPSARKLLLKSQFIEDESLSLQEKSNTDDTPKKSPERSGVLKDIMNTPPIRVGKRLGLKLTMPTRHEKTQKYTETPPLESQSPLSSQSIGRDQLSVANPVVTKAIVTPPPTLESQSPLSSHTNLDVSAITSRVLVMPCPSESLESAHKTNNIEDVKVYIESHYALEKVSVYNFGPKSCSQLPPPVRTVDGSSVFPLTNKAPQLQGMYSLIEGIYGFLSADPKSIVIIQGADDGRATAATMTCALLIYANLVHQPEDALQIFAVRRMPPNLRPSENRYLQYLADIVRATPNLPHFKPITLKSVSCTPIPRMTKARDGCRLYIEIVSNDKVVMSTVQEGGKMRLYHANEEKIEVNLNATICGDFGIILYHARNGLGGSRGLKICQFQMHTGFIHEQETLLQLDRSELDDLPDNEHIPMNFSVSVRIEVQNTERPPASNCPWIPLKSQTNPLTLFSSQLEHDETVMKFPFTQSTAKPTCDRSAPPRKSIKPLNNSKWDEPANCPVCDKTFSRRDNMQKHLKNVHNIKK